MHEIKYTGQRVLADTNMQRVLHEDAVTRLGINPIDNFCACIINEDVN